MAPLVGAAIGTLVILGLVPAIRNLAESVQPPERWIEITNLRALNAELGDVPVVLADHSIHRSLLARLRVTLRKKDEESGLYVFVCSRATERHFIPQSKLPEQTTLSYWAEVPPNPPCLPHEPGIYMVSLWATIHSDHGERVQPIDLLSNDFVVTEAEQ